MKKPKFAYSTCARLNVNNLPDMSVSERHDIAQWLRELSDDIALLGFGHPKEGFPQRFAARLIETREVSE